ncbi:ketosynthase chain-length factor [Saccharomonospora sp.]|uniref:ketosynthase chain-length factor n=1 Tax=Saccharomonospora sp. TaxID=33913 RepID=UPI00261E76F3|nr:ketosynthase chain-length factor [Saccharomonospora sp.]
MTPSAAQSPVITGIGVLAPTGIGTEQHWRSVLTGKSGISGTTLFDATPYPVRLAGQVPGFTAEEYVPRRLIPQTDRWSHLALAATDQALADAGIDPAAEPEYSMAVVTASSSGGTEFGQHEMERLYAKGPQWVSAYQSIAWFYAATTGQISIRHGMRGPCGVVCGEQAGGLDAVGQAARHLVRDVDLVVTGGTDAPLCPYGLVAQLSSGHLSTASEPATAYLPFDVDASGFVPGEGGAILLAERATHAAARNARFYGRIRGYAAGFDPPPGSSRPPALAATIRRALNRARMSVEDVDVLFADGMGVPEQDRAEAEAITELFGPKGVPVTAPKTLTGRLYGGGAALDVATALLSLRDGVIPHTVGPHRLAPGCAIDLVLGAPREQPLRTALVVARGFGGFTAALILSAP